MSVRRTRTAVRATMVASALLLTWLSFSGASSAGGAACSDGMEKSEDTRGRCCWPGQVWTTRCIGLPTSCPTGYSVDAAEQSCTLSPCESGRVRVEKTPNCCWPKQGWSRTRSACVGVPECPLGFEPEGESCVSADRDGDGITNSEDRCAEQPEDRDGFEDNDGCPDPDNDKDNIADGVDRCPNEAEDVNDFQDDDGCPDQSELDRVMMVREQERQRIEDERRKESEAKARAELERAKAEQRERALAEWMQNRDSAAAYRTAGFVVTGVGVASLVSSYYFWQRSTQQMDDVRTGGFATSADIERAVEASRQSAIGSIALGAAGGAAVTVGAILVLANWSVAKPENVSTLRSGFDVIAGGGRVSLRGSF